MNPPQGDPRSDAELISSVRSGDPAAFGVLYSRHAAATTAMARYYASDHFSADDLVSEAFERTFATLRAGGGPDVSFRAYVYTAVRRLAFETAEKSRRTHVTDDFSPFEVPEESTDPAIESFEGRMVTTAFATLPERWQAVLWYLEVEGMKPPEVAPLLGLTPNGVSALAYRAREGLREAYLQAHIPSAARDPECDRLRGKLGAFVNGTLAARDSAKVEKHASGCEECAAIIAELRDEGHGLRAFVAPLVLGGAAAAGLLAGQRPQSASARTVRGSRKWAAAGVVAAAIVGLAAVASVAGILSLTTTTTEVDPAAPPPAAAPEQPSGTPTARPTTTPTAPPTAPPPVPSRSPSPRPTEPPAPPPPAPSPTPPPTAAPTTIEVAVQDVGDLVVGREGMVGATVTAGPAAASDVTLRFELPAGVTVDPGRSMTAGGWSCDSTSSSVDCSVPALGAGTESSVFVPVAVSDSAELGAAPVATVTAGNAPESQASAPGVVAHGLGTRFLANGTVASTLAGASFVSCDPLAPGCADARNRAGDPAVWDNGSWPLVALDEAGTGEVSAVSELEIPAGAEVVFAGLYWSGDTPAGQSDAALGSIDVLPPGGGATAVTAERVDHAVLAGVDRYQSFADVTELVGSSGSGTWALSGALVGSGPAPAPGGPVPTNSYAGWSLVVVFEHEDEPRGRVTVFDGFQTVSDAPTSFAITGLPGRDIAVGVVAWEGDANLTGDGVSLDGTPLARAAGPADPGNVFASFAEGSAIPNTFGVDVGFLSPLALENPRALLTASTAGDQYIIGAVTVATR